jgi:hypothetical protein
VTEHEIEKHISKLKKAKAADYFGVTSEHIQYAAPEIVKVLTIVTNSILTTGKIPLSMKTGLITPVPKKGKDHTRPDGYRRITVSSVLGKVAEKELLKRAKPTLNRSQSRMQFGFTEGCSYVNAALLITESVGEALDQKSTPCITYMDASKAFDVVDHVCMLNSLYRQRIDGKIWSAFNDMYTGITSRVKWHGAVSNSIQEAQGIRQGAESSAKIFNAKNNAVLNRLEMQPHNFRIGCNPVGAIMVADDLALISNTRQGAQQLVNIAEQDASEGRYTFSTTKTRTMMPKKGRRANRVDPHLHLNNKEIETTDQETHLGIERTVWLSNEPTILERIKVTRRLAYAMMGAGLHGLNGINPMVSKQIWDCYLTPALLHGLEALILSRKDYRMLEDFYRKNLKQFQHLPEATANPAAYLLTGALPVEGLLHKRILSFYANMLRRGDCLEKDVLQRQLAMKLLASNSWTSNLRELLHMYELPSAYELLSDPPPKRAWKETLNAAINSLPIPQS